MKTAFINLLKVKSIITIVLTVIFSMLALKGTITGAEFLTIFVMVIGFYFGTQTKKTDSTDIATSTDTVTTTE